TNFIDALTLFEADPQTEAVVLIGEIGGTDEEEAARFIRRHVKKPVVAFVAGQTAPAGKRMGHAGAIISGGTGTAAEKMAAFEAASVPVARIPSEIPALVRELLGRRRPRAVAGVARKRASKPSAARARAAGSRKTRGTAAASAKRRAVAKPGRNGTRRSAAPPRASTRRAAGRRRG